MYLKTEYSAAGTGGPGGPLALPIYDRSVNPIPTGGGQIMPTITTGPPKVFHLPASLLSRVLLKLDLKINKMIRRFLLHIFQHVDTKLVWPGYTLRIRKYCENKAQIGFFWQALF